MISVTPRSALVTGASGGIGMAISEVLVDEGFALTMVARQSDKLEQAADAMRSRGALVHTFAGNLADEAAIVEAVATHRRHFGSLDVLVNNAGVGAAGPIESLTTKQLDLQLNVNLRSVILFYREALDLLTAAGEAQGRALVVNLSSITGRHAEPTLAVYSATKAAVTAFTAAMNGQLFDRSIHSTALCPGYVDTPMAGYSYERVPQTDMIPASDVAEVVRMLVRLSKHTVVPDLPMMRPGAVPDGL